MIQKTKQGDGRSPTGDHRALLTPKSEIILSGAMQEFLAHGYAGTSMDRVATTAGVSKATIYSHFKDKEGLFAALIRQMAEEKMAFIGDEALLEGSARQILANFIAQGFQQIQADDQYISFIRLIIGESGRFPRLAELFVQNFSKPGIDQLAKVFNLHPAFEVKDSEATARIVIGSIVHYKLMQDILHAQKSMPFESHRIINTLIDLICGPEAQD